MSLYHASNFPFATRRSDFGGQNDIFSKFKMMPVEPPKTKTKAPSNEENDTSPHHHRYQLQIASFHHKTTNNMQRFRASPTMRRRNHGQAAERLLPQQHQDEQCCRAHHKDSSFTACRSKSLVLLVCLTAASFLYGCSLLFMQDSSLHSSLQQYHATMVERLAVSKAPALMIWGNETVAPDYGDIHYMKATKRTISENDTFYLDHESDQEERVDWESTYDRQEETWWEEDPEECQAPEWKTMIHPTCNIMHESNLVGRKDSYQRGYVLNE